MRRSFIFPALLAGFVLLASNLHAQRPDHIVVVILENKAYGLIIGNPEAPHINALAAANANIAAEPNDPTGARSGSHALRHPSQPNYLELYSGNNQGVVQDGLPGTPFEPTSPALPFNTANLGTSLRHAGYTFATYSEDLPYVGFTGESATDDPLLTKYERKHNPAVNWQSADAPANNHLPLSVNQPFFPLPGQPGTGFPVNDFSKLPTVSFVIPNQQHDMHDGSVAAADTWLKQNIFDTYLAWAQTHNSLLILTFDEDNFDDPTDPNPSQTSNLITTIFAGPMIKHGAFPETDLNVSNPDVRPPNGFITPTGTAMNHYNVLSTIEDIYGLPRIGGSIGRPPVNDVFETAITLPPLVVPNGQAGSAGDVGNLFPLFSGKPIRYQQIFQRNSFARLAAAGGTINGLAFRVHGPHIPFTAVIPQLQVNLSTTSKAPDALSSIFAENIGTNDTQVFSGPLSVNVTTSSTTSDPQAFDIVINFPTPFPYDPRAGNLLVDIRNVQGATEMPPLDQELDATSAMGDAVARVFNYGDVSAPAAGQTGGVDEKDTLGLVTQFATTVNPATATVPLIRVGSRKTHGGGNDFEVNLPIGGDLAVECRSGGATGDFTVVFTFANPLSSVGGPSVTEGSGQVNGGAIGADPHQYMVNLSGVSNAQLVTVKLTNVQDTSNNSGDVSQSLVVLAGDTNGDRRVNIVDTNQTKSRAGQITDGDNFRSDVNLDGRINIGDTNFVKANAGNSVSRPSGSRANTKGE